MTSNGPKTPVWPPPADDNLPEPLLSCVHALSLARMRWYTNGLVAPDDELSDRPAWHRLVRAQVREAAEPDSTLRHQLIEHIRPFAPFGDTDEKRATGALRSIVSGMALFVVVPKPPPLDVTDRDRHWMHQWTQQTARTDWRSLPVPDRRDLLELRLRMGDMDAIRDVVRADATARLRDPSDQQAWPPDPSPIQLDLDLVAAAFPEHDADRVVRLAGRALSQRHIVGLLEHDDLVALGLDPLDHPCGIEIADSEHADDLDRFHRALTGTSARDRIVLEWARHEGLRWGEDEDLMFFVDDLPGLRASLDDPWNVKTDQVRAQIDKILSHNPERAAELKQYRYRSALHELFDAWRMPEYFHVDLAMSLDNAARQLAHQGLLPELTESLEQVVSRSHDDDSARLAFGDVLEGVVVADGPDGCYWSLAVGLRDRLHRMRDSRIWPPASSLLEFPRCQRTSTFVDDATDVRVREALVELHQDPIEAFLSGATGSDHLVLYADLSDVLGVVGSVIIGDEPAVSTFTASNGVVDTTCAVMVMARVDGVVGVVAAYPDVLLDPVVRATYPALCQFFTTAFHQKSVSAVGDVARVMRELRNPAWTAVRDELTLLLHLDDEVELRRIVENCGSYLLPAQTRHWVQCLLWRFDAFDWHPDRDGVL